MRLNKLKFIHIRFEISGLIINKSFYLLMFDWGIRLVLHTPFKG